MKFQDIKYTHNWRPLTTKEKQFILSKIGQSDIEVDDIRFDDGWYSIPLGFSIKAIDGFGDFVEFMEFYFGKDELRKIDIIKKDKSVLDVDRNIALLHATLNQETLLLKWIIKNILKPVFGLDVDTYQILSITYQYDKPKVLKLFIEEKLFPIKNGFDLCYMHGATKCLKMIIDHFNYKPDIDSLKQLDNSLSEKSRKFLIKYLDSKKK